MRQTAKRRARNQATKREVKTAFKAFMAHPSAESFQKVQSELDISVKKNLVPKNTAARRLSHLAEVAKAAGVKLKSSAKKPVAASKTVAAKKTASKAAPSKPVAAKKTAKPTVTKKAPAVKKSAAKPKTKATTKKPAK